MGRLTAGWDNFFVAEAGAAAALSGLLFVAVSLSLSRIVASRHLKPRATESLMQFLSVLVVATFGLVPAQGDDALGWEILVTGLAMALLSARRHWRAYRDPALEPAARQWLWVRVVMAYAACAPFVVAGALLLAGSRHALLWVVPGTLGSFFAGAFNAWVLLVEIQK